MAELATIARPYAEALFQVARHNDAKAWGEQVQALAQVAADASFRQFADNPKVSSDQVFDVIASASRQTLAPAVQNFLRTVIENGRTVALPAIAEQYHTLVNALSGVSDVTIHSAYPIDSAALPEVVAALEKRFGRKLSASVVIDPDLIGGIRAVVGDEVLDTSVKARLDSMKVALTA
ncbi:F0F1 ATP synthase subunit delta [Aquabacterium sp.]|uniref:F0F1 ATP synthase subunit delta n=1 Tax=Aquabacterium sp. TaxID=1872578 RepID=UPI0035B395CC